MPVGRPKSTQFGPSMLDTIEVGDRFTRTGKNGRKTVFIVEGKIYNDDLTITYQMSWTQGNKRSSSKLHESSICKRFLYRRTFKAPREQVMTEKKYEGVFYGTA